MNVIFMLIMYRWTFSGWNERLGHPESKKKIRIGDTLRKFFLDDDVWNFLSISRRNGINCFNVTTLIDVNKFLNIAEAPEKISEHFLIFSVHKMFMFDVFDTCISNFAYHGRYGIQGNFWCSDTEVVCQSFRHTTYWLAAIDLWR